MFSVSLNLAGKAVVVVGGGAVGWRRATAAARDGAVVTVVDCKPRPAGFDHPEVSWHAEPYRADQIRGARLVFAAATPEVNIRVVADATQQGIWVCDVADPSRSDFFVPAVLRQGGLTLTVDTGGAAPALARAIRDRLAKEFDEPFAVWVALLAEVRPHLARCVLDPEARRGLAASFCDWSWLERIRRDGPEVVRQAIRLSIERAASGGTGSSAAV